METKKKKLKKKICKIKKRRFKLFYKNKIWK